MTSDIHVEEALLDILPKLAEKKDDEIYRSLEIWMFGNEHDDISWTPDSSRIGRFLGNNSAFGPYRVEKVEKQLGDGPNHWRITKEDP